MVIGILAHVDAGKTTLSEALLYKTGSIRQMGRVDNQNTFLDTDSQERERGITIFSKQARFTYRELEVTLLDTPGHVDFSAEMERALVCLDYAILVISGSEGVQGHTRTLWRLLDHYQIPALIFVNKMDLEGPGQEAIARELKEELSDGCIDMTPFTAGMTAREEDWENVACLSEDLLNEYMENGEISDGRLADAVASRQLFPCFFGSALQPKDPMESPRGVAELLEGLRRYTKAPRFPAEFGARVYKIGRDPRGSRLTWLKVTGGSLKVRDRISYLPQRKAAASEASAEEAEEEQEDATGLLTEKVDQIRCYSGDRFETREAVNAGEIVAVTGLSATFPGQGLGAETDEVTGVLEPVLNYQLILPSGVSPLVFMEKMRLLEEEDPKLRVVWKPQVREIHVQLMGEIQMQVLKRLIWDRYQVAVNFGPGSIVYKETIARPVEGVGHFEPLRHYAEVHLLMEPADPGSGITVTSVCPVEVLERNWQRLIATHVEERVHKGVLTGSALTDVKFTIVSGRAHIKHTEGGDFRQATYRAIRQGLKSTESLLLEPYYRLRLEVPMEFTGRALTDLEQRCARVEAPEFVNRGSREMAVIAGRAPVSCMQDYVNEVHAYTKGLGSLQLDVSGYDVCHNPEEVIAAARYDSELDFRNPTGSVFCAHGSGFVVPWDQVPTYMHLDYAIPPAQLQEMWDAKTDLADQVEVYQAKSFATAEAELLSGAASRTTSWSHSVSRMSETELDAELADVYAREFGMSAKDMETEQQKKRIRPKSDIPEGLSGKPRHVKYDQHGNPIYPKADQKKDLLIVDGYNVIFSWQELKDLSKSNIDSARDSLIDTLCNYQGYRRCRLIVVFDAWKVKENPGKSLFYDGVSRKMTTLKAAREKAASPDAQGIEIIYTRTDEIADARIERLVHDEKEKYHVTVVTNDGLEQLTILSLGALRMTGAELQQDIERVSRQALEEYRNKGKL